jgi:ribosomal protein L16 Arg81 hydroxylase
MISNLQDLVAPLTEAEYLDALLAGKMLLRRSSGENRFATMLDWDTFRKVIESDIVPRDKLLVTRQGQKVPEKFYRDQGKLNAARLASLVSQGISLSVKKVDSYVPTLRALCDNIETRVGERVNAAAVMTTGEGGALRVHYDFYDIIVVQIEGSKRWRIYDPPVVNPIKEIPMPAKPPDDIMFDEVLQPGDFLSLPSGYWHHCDNGPGRSLHILIMFKPLTGSAGLKALLSQLLTEPIFRVRIGRLAGEERTAHEAALKTYLIEKVGQISLSELLAHGNKAAAHADSDDY